MKEFVEYIVKNLVDNPDQVKINEIAEPTLSSLSSVLKKLTSEKSLGKREKPSMPSGLC